MEKIASFTIDHLKLTPGVYVSRKDHVGAEVITTFDLRMTSPNDEPVMNTAEVHTIEHLAATFLRNHPVYGDKTVYFGPMGCRTGFYLLVRDTLSPTAVYDLLTGALRKVPTVREMFGAKRKMCGNYRGLSLAAAKAECAAYLQALLARGARFDYPKKEDTP